MFKRIRQIAGLSAMGMCFQFLGCDSADIATAVTDGIKNTTLDVANIVFDAAIDEALGLD